MEIEISEGLLVVMGYLLSFLMSLHIVLERREPTATLAWVLGVLALPYLGIMMYVLIGRRRLNRQIKRRRIQADRLAPVLGDRLADTSQVSTPQTMPDEVNVLQRLSSRIGLRGPTAGNEVTLLPEPNQAYAAIEQAIEAATHHVHFQFYTMEPDKTGERFRDLLTAKAKQGIEVRVLTDGVGSFSLDDRFMEPLLNAGGQWSEFLPVGRLSRHWHPNLRNHRKIVIVDGAIGFTGGVNVGDAYTGRKKHIGLWRDTHLQIRGPAVAHMQEVFAEDWHFATGQDPNEEGWFPALPASGDCAVHIVASGPDTDTQPIQRIFFAAVNMARRRICLTTPYFIPDQAMRVALETAALRGVDVRLMLPAKSDAPLVLYAGRSYYDELISSGVRIFEYQKGILHAKALAVDDTWATVGSANMDVRSFLLNFEVNAAIYGSAITNQVVAQFEQDLKDAVEITADDLSHRRSIQRLAESVARTMSPVL